MIACSTRHNLNPPSETPLTGFFPHLSFNSSFSDFFGGSNVQHKNNGSYVDLILDKTSGAGLVSRNMYRYGFFSAAIKLPSSFTAGVVVAFYMSNANAFPHNHDEIDFELLGHEKSKEWALQTNVYGNGSVGTGREEKFYLWFDPTEDFHEYSFIWNNHHIVFLVDSIPVREVYHNEAMAGAYPSKPMSLYSTIWDGSQWATRGGKKPANYKYAPFVASFKNMEMAGCVGNQKGTATPCAIAGGQDGHLSLDPVEGGEFSKLSQQQQVGMEWVRGRFMFYSYCKDPNRFKVMPPECKASN